MTRTVVKNLLSLPCEGVSVNLRRLIHLLPGSEPRLLFEHSFEFEFELVVWSRFKCSAFMSRL
ncbi:hypothetical protein HanIR_Chr03g0119861 [Helianthus annuus]|nr:hypothetical protein HanIR_Chr03g0119861 [Helianthus annuus]